MCVSISVSPPKRGIIFFCYLRMTPSYVQRERVLFHSVCQVSTVAQNGQTKHRPRRGSFMSYENKSVSIKLGDRYDH